jgi:hypothetical protein
MMTTLITFLDIKSTAHFEFIPQGHTINRAYYVEILKGLHEAVHRKRPEVWPNDWILCHAKARDHKTLSGSFFSEKSITEMEHPTCSPDLAPNDMWLFPKINSPFR